MFREGALGALPRPYGFPIRDLQTIRLRPGRAAYSIAAGTNPATGLSESGHRAFDMNSDGRVRSGAEIIAIADGTVTYAPAAESSAAGWFIVTKHIDTINQGDIYVRCLHMRAASTFKTGDVIERGDTLGYVGNSGNSTVAHLHFDIYKQWPRAWSVNPVGYYYIGDVKNLTDTKTFVFEDMIESLTLFGVPTSADAVD